jgi:hypothetical protein
MLPRRRDEFEWTLGFYNEVQVVAQVLSLNPEVGGRQALDDWPPGEANLLRNLERAKQQLPKVHAADPDVHRRNGGSFSSGELAREYGFTDVDGSQPDWGRWFDDVVLGELDPAGVDVSLYR